MKQDYKNERVLDLETITDRHVLREIEGFTSWRHFVVHQDRAWLLAAIEKLQKQAKKALLNAGNTGDGEAIDAELQKLLGMFEEEQLNHLGDEDE
jgi:hypothetical protein